MNGGRQEIGWKPLWFMMRGYQVLMAVFAFVIAVVKPPRRMEEILLSLAIGLIILLVFDMMARGTANERGITFVRYRDEQFVPWRDVEEVTWNPKGIRIKLRDRHFLRRYVMFGLKSNVRRGFAFAFGGEVEEPEFIQWLRASGYLDESTIRRSNRWSW